MHAARVLSPPLPPPAGVMYARLHMHETAAGSENRRGFPLASERDLAGERAGGERRERTEKNREGKRNGEESTGIIMRSLHRHANTA